MAKKESFAKVIKGRMSDQIISRMKKNSDFVITSYMGSSVSDLEQLRRNLKKTSANYMVVKNSIIKNVFKELKLSDMESNIEGGVGISFSGTDIVTTCKTLVTFAKDHEKFKIRAAFVDGKPMAQDKVKQLASLPTKEILLAQVVAGIKSPITGFVNVLGGVLRKFVYVVDAIKTSKQNAGAKSAQEQKA